MLKRLQRLVRSWYGSFMERVAGEASAGEDDAGSDATTPTDSAGRAADAPDLDERFEQLESRRLVEEIRRGGGSGTPPAPVGPMEKTIGPAAGPTAPAVPSEPPVEKTIGPAPPPAGMAAPPTPCDPAIESRRTFPTS